MKNSWERKWFNKEVNVLNKELMNAEKSIFFQRLKEHLSKFGIMWNIYFTNEIQCFFNTQNNDGYIGRFTFYKERSFGNILEINLCGKTIYEFYTNHYNWSRLDRDLKDIIKFRREKILEREKWEIRNERLQKS